MFTRKMMMITAALGTVGMINVHAEEPSAAGSVQVGGQKTVMNLDGTIGNESADSILGDSWYYGVVADEFDFNGEAETNFAVNRFVHQYGSGGQTGVTDKGAGSQKAFFLAGSVDSSFMVKGISGDISAPVSVHEKFVNSTNGTLEFHDVTADTVQTYVSDLLADAQGQSDRLGALDSMSDYSTMPSGQMTIDVTPYGTGTVYLNADRWDGLKNALQQSSGVTIEKNRGQKIVFNFPSSSDVTLQKIVVKENGTQTDGSGLANVSTAVNDTASDLIYNMPAASVVSLNDTTGIILAPQAEVHCYGVDGGWVNCQKMVNDCEWHFTNGMLPESRVLGARRVRPHHYEEEKPQETGRPQEEEKPQETVKPEETAPSVPAEEVKPEEELPKEEKIEKTEEKKTETPLLKEEAEKKDTVPASVHENPETGDNEHVFFYTGIMLAALGSAAAMLKICHSGEK